MKVITLHAALLTAMLSIAVVAAGHAGARNRPPAPREGGGASKVEYCKDCHGLSGQGYRGYLTMPRLAGQQSEYIESQLLRLRNARIGIFADIQLDPRTADARQK